MKSLARLVLCSWITLPVAAELPIQPTEKLQFETSEVTWLSVDISPDGRQFVLDVLGDLYLLDRAGGVANPLSQGIEFDFQPVFSPDGSKLAFISDRSGTEDLWVMDVDGANARKLTSSGERIELASPSWSPNGDHVIVSRTNWGLRTFEVWAYHLDGGKGVQLTESKPNNESSQFRHNALGAVYSPAGKYLYFAYRRGGFGYNQTLPLWQVVRRELATGRNDTLTSAQGSAFKPRISPDGTYLVYGTRFDTQTGLRIRHLESGVDEWLIYPVQRDDQESRFTRDLLPNYAISPDSSAVFFSVDGKLREIDVVSRKVIDIPFSIPVALDVNPRLDYSYGIGRGPVKAQLIRDLEMAPDGSRMAFSALAQLHVHDIDANSTKRLTDGTGFVGQPCWSPDGRLIAYVEWHEDRGSIWLSRADGRRQPRQLTSRGLFYTDPVFTQSGDHIVALRGSAYERAYGSSDLGPSVDTDLVLIAVKDGSERLIRHAPNMYTPHWGPELDRVYVYVSSGFFGTGASGLKSMKLDGTDLRSHLVLKGPGIYSAEKDVHAQLLRISPDGVHVLAKHANQLYVVKLLQTGVLDVDTRLKNSALPIESITDVGVDYFGWNADGSDIYWSVGHDYYVRPLDSIDFAPSKSSDSKTTTARAQASEEHGDAKVDKDLDSKIKELHPSVHNVKIETYTERRRPQGSLLLKNAHVLTMADDRHPNYAAADVLVSKDRIEAVGQNVANEAEAHVLDLEGKYLLPGYIDTHAHIPFFRRIPSKAVWGLHANLAYGVTTAVDVQPSTIDILEYEDLVDAGTLVGPRTLSTGPGVFNNNAFKSKRHAEGVLRRYKEHYGVRNIKAYISGNRKQRHWLLQAARELKMMPTAEGALDLKLDLTHAIDGMTGNEHNLPVIGIYKDVIELMARTKIAYTPTLLVSYGGPFGESHFFTNENPRGDPKLARFTPPVVLESLLLRRSWFHADTHVYAHHAASAYEIVKHGGQVGVGSHGQLQGLGFHWELWALHSGGFSNYDALRAATRHGAEMIGIAEDVGTIESGKLADFVVLNADPLDDIRATDEIAYVIRGGIVYDGETLSEIWPTSRELPEPYWLNQLPP